MWQKITLSGYHSQKLCPGNEYSAPRAIKKLAYFFFAGPLLEAVQMAAIYPDSKTFVDKKLKLPPGKIIKNFETLLNQHNGSLLSVDEIKKVRSDFNHLD